MAEKQKAIRGRLKNSLPPLSINEQVGDVPTHYMKSGSSMRPKAQLDELKIFRERILPKWHRGLRLEYDLWFNTNEIHTIRAWLYTDFMGNGLLFKVNSVKINDKIFKSIVDSDIKIDEERIDKIINNFRDKYLLKDNETYHDKVIFPPGTNLLTKEGKDMQVIDWGRVRRCVEDGFVIKPHPITTNLFVAKFKKDYGKDRVLDKKVSGMDLLLKAKEVACSPNSETGLIALLLDKGLRLISTPKIAREKSHLTYESIYATIADQKNQSSKDALSKILSSKRSGIIFDFDEDAEERVERYFDNFWDYKIKL